MAFAVFLREFTAVISGFLIIAAWIVTSIIGFDSIHVPVVRPVMVLLAYTLSMLILFYYHIYRDRRKIKDVFSRYVSDTILKQVLSTDDQDFLKGKRRRLSIMMADIRGFTSFSEKRDAQEIVTFLNAYFSRLTEIIMRNNGVVDKFLGDGILAFFNAPVEETQFADNALKAAKEIYQYVNSQEFADISANSGLKTGIALHSGDAVYGNIGSSRKAEFTVIGDTVNTCSRLESMTKELRVDIVMSRQFVVDLTDKNSYTRLGVYDIRGKEQSVELFSVKDLGAEK